LSRISDIRDCILYCDWSPAKVSCHCCAWHTFTKCEFVLCFAYLFIYWWSHFANIFN